MRRLLAVLLLSYLIGIPAFATNATTPTATTPTKPAPIPGRSVNDAQLDAAIRTKLAKSKIGKDGFRFHVQRGVVTWEGTTTVGQHKGAATRMARASGAVQVVNNIKVTGKASGPLRKAYVQP
jgi:osmotically-inducible protein OsmY